DAIIVKIPAQLLTGASGGATPPTVAITNPTPGATLSGTVSVTADASDPAGIANVQFLLDGTNLGSAVTQAPYTVSWNTTTVTAGTHTLTAMATDTSGLSTTSGPITVTTQGNTTPPVISAVAAGSVSSSGATVTWTTDQPGTSQVVYGTTAAYGSSSAVNTNLVTAHTVVLTGLTAGTTYHYEVKSANSSGTLATSPDAVFTTGSGSSGGLPNPLGWWKLNEGGGSTAVDSSGNGYTGSILGSPSWGTGLEGTDLLLDGTDDYVDVPSSSALNAFPLSISFWIKTADSSGLHGLINKYYPSSFNGYQVFLNNGNLCAWYFRDSSDYVWDGSSCTLSTPGIANNQWHHVVFVVDATGGNLYVDDVKTASQTWTGSYGPTSTNQDLEFGQYPGTTTPFVSGALSDVRLYASALTAQQVATLYNAVPKVQNVVWTNVVNATVNGNSVQKTSGCDGCADAGAVSQQQISGNGYLQFTASETTALRVAGLAPVGTAESRASMPFAILLQAGDAEVLSYGVYQTDVPFASGDVFKIMVQAGVVSYYKNGKLIYTSTQTPSFPLAADVVLNDLGSTITNAIISTGL
ncbi:MAG TPA: LamG-like jellyroll fold domain-containing protein, partial [Gammaproteobacteria bacterium]|nr:LamG-like jellyroll fold domain-containing protein [Gammaproteobacteria bacterium]